VSLSFQNSSMQIFFLVVDSGKYRKTEMHLQQVIYTESTRKYEVKMCIHRWCKSEKGQRDERECIQSNY
jgi:hypothetical protein